MKTTEHKSTTLVVGASGATGRLLVDQLLIKGHQVRAIVRDPDMLPQFMKNRKGLSIIKASILDLTDQEIAKHVKGCNAIASCLGHNFNLKGIYGNPRRLVTDAVKRLCKAAMRNEPEIPVKFILMNTTGNRNRDLDEPISFAQKCVIGLLRILLPPHVDNEKAADYLRTRNGEDHPTIEWVAVRPDGLIDEDQVTEYEIHPSPTRSAIFDAGKTSRINVGNFMANLINDETRWKKWKGKMPVIYNKMATN